MQSKDTNAEMGATEIFRMPSTEATSPDIMG